MDFKTGFALLIIIIVGVYIAEMTSYNMIENKKKYKAAMMLQQQQAAAAAANQTA